MNECFIFRDPARNDREAEEVYSVLQQCRHRAGWRPWIAMVAAYALALQLLLAGLAAAHQVAASGDAAAGDLFVICHAGDGLAGDADGTGKPPLPRSTCVLCTLTSTACAILPSAHGISTVDVKLLSGVLSRDAARIISYDSPTGQYQRGPPASVC
jgi:hypothetical protein